MKTNKVSTNHYESERGQSLVELAMGFMVLMVLLAGIIDLSRLLSYSVSLRDAAEEGVHYGSLNPTGDISSHVKIAMDSSVTVNVSYLNNTKCTGDQITVQVVQPSFQFDMPFIGAILGSQTIPLTSSYSGVVLRPACP